MRIAIVDDIETERALLKMRLERQLSLYGVEPEILEFDPVGIRNSARYCEPCV